MPPTPAFGLLLALLGISGFSFGLYALLRGGRGQRCGIGPIPERGVHVVAGIRMLLVGALSLAAGAYLLWNFSWAASQFLNPNSWPANYSVEGSRRMRSE